MATDLHANRNNRVSRFPGTRDGEARPKRPLALVDLESAVQGTKESVQRLHKRPALLKQLPKTATNPWERYRKIFKINQAGSSYVIHANDETFREGILKAVKTSRSELSKIINSPHRNFVHLQEAFYHDSQIFFIYEVMDISLAQIFSSPLGRLQLFEVAAFSKELLEGVQHIHDSLKITHGDLTSNNILLSVTGAIKIANIGTSMLENRDIRDSQEDVKAIGQIVLECLEPSTFLRKGSSLKNTWPPHASDFVESTKSDSAKRLLKHDFLQLSPGPSCLKPYIRFGREVAAKEVEITEIRDI